MEWKGVPTRSPSTTPTEHEQALTLVGLQLGTLWTSILLNEVMKLGNMGNSKVLTVSLLNRLHAQDPRMTSAHGHLKYDRDWAIQ